MQDCVIIYDIKKEINVSHKKEIRKTTNYKAIAYGMLALAASIVPLAIGVADIGGEMTRGNVQAIFYDYSELIGFVSMVAMGWHLKKTKTLSIDDATNLSNYKEILGKGQMYTGLGAATIMLNGANYMPEDGVFPALYLLTHAFVLFTMSKSAINAGLKNEHLIQSIQSNPSP